MRGKNLKTHVFLVKSSIAPYINVRKMLISCVKLDHALYSINYGMHFVPESVYCVLVNLHCLVQSS